MKPLPPPSTYQKLESAAKRITQLERELEEAKRTSVELFDHAKRWRVELGQAKTDRAKAESDLALSATRTYTLQSQLTAHKVALVKAREKLDAAQRAMPAFHEGGFIVEHHDMDGNYLGSENVDPVAIVQWQSQAIDEALTAINEVLEEKK